MPDAAQFIKDSYEPDLDQFLKPDLDQFIQNKGEEEEDYREPEPEIRRERRTSYEDYSRRPREDDYYYEEYPPYNSYDYYEDYEDYEPTKSPLRFIPLVLVIAVCVLCFIAARTICYDVPINASDYSKMTYTVMPGLTDEQLARDLVEMGLIDNPLVFRLRCIFYDADYQEGTYELSPCYSTEKIINILSGYQYGE